MTQIIVEPTGDSYLVTVAGRAGTTTHEVTVDQEDLDALAPNGDGVALVEASFRFLLDREPASAIMRSFDLSVISRYFPEYRRRIGDYLDAGP